MSIIGAIFVPLLIIYSVNFLVSTIAGRLFFQRGDAIALAIAINAFGAQGANAAPVIAISYIIQV